MKQNPYRLTHVLVTVFGLLLQACAGGPHPLLAPVDRYNDLHFHISNYAMQGVSLKTLIDDYMGERVQRSTAMTLPLQQKGDPYEHYADDKIAPNYYWGRKPLFITIPSSTPNWHWIT